MLLQYSRIWLTEAIHHLFAKTVLSALIFTRFFHSLRIRFASSLFSFLIELSLFPMIKNIYIPPLVVGRFIKAMDISFCSSLFPWFWVSSTTFMKLDWEFVCFFNLRNHWFMLGWLSHTMVFTLSDLKYIWTSLAQAHKEITLSWNQLLKSFTKSENIY